MTHDEDITVSPTAARLTLNSSTNLSILNSTQSPAIMKKNKKGETPLQIAVIKVWNFRQMEDNQLLK